MKNDLLLTRKAASYLSLISLFLLFFLIMTMSTGCEKEADQPASMTAFAEKQSCEGCHTDATLLKELATPEPPAPETGGG